MPKAIQIKEIRRKTLEDVYDIHHKISEEEFLEEHPNLVANGMVISNCGRHAGGVIISDNVYDNMPVKRSGKVMQTPWTEGVNAHHLEPLGFLKFDILAVGTLRVIEETIRKIIAKELQKQDDEIEFQQIKEWFYKNLHPDNNMLDDQRVYEYVYHQGNWGGVFQFAQAPVRQFAQALKPRSIDDLSATTSIYRPGPLKAKVDKMFLSNREDPDSVKYLHPMLKEILANEAGCVLEGTKVNTPDGEIEIEEIVDLVQNDEIVEVYSYNEETKELENDIVVGGICTGKKATVIINFNDGTTLELTEDHLVYTLDGYKKASELTEADEIVSIG